MAELPQCGTLSVSRFHSVSEILLDLKVKVKAEFVFQLALHRGAPG
jgi:hypothetical protein